MELGCTDVDGCSLDERRRVTAALAGTLSAPWARPRRSGGCIS
jgi:hypothetical protein